MISNSTSIFHLSQVNFTKVPEAYIVDKTVDEVCMGEKSSNCLIHKIILVLKTDGYLLLQILNKCKVPKGLLNLDSLNFASFFFFSQKGAYHGELYWLCN